MSSPQSFSCDLVTESKKHVAFLRQLHRLGVTLQPVTVEMVQRYAIQWLPLVAAVSSHQAEDDASKQPLQQLVPPPDIAWLWHCHRLAPARYQAYCEARFGRILEPNPSFCFQVEEGQPQQAGTIGSETSDSDINSSSSLATQQAWARIFSGEPFFYVSPTENEEKANKNEEGAPPERSSLPPCLACDKNKSLLLDGFDIGASSQCQANFLWQVSGSRFTEDSFLEEGAINYYKFLQLSSSSTGSSSSLPLVPTYQIDLMWHTHMLIHTENYNQDCIRIRGSTFHHDDSLNDRTKGAKLDRAFRETVRLWKQAYPGHDYVVEGGMYRGEPADIYFQTDLWSPELGYDAGDCFGNNVIVAGSSSSGTTNNDCRWEFLDDTGWKAFSDEHQGDIEHAFRNLQAACHVEIKSGNWTYSVNVVTMEQTNVQHPGRKTRALSGGLCGGVLIAPDFVLTAAHCGGVFRGKTIYLGGHDIDDHLPGRTRHRRKSVKHGIATKSYDLLFYTKKKRPHKGPFPYHPSPQNKQSTNHLSISVPKEIITASRALLRYPANGPNGFVLSDSSHTTSFEKWGWELPRLLFPP